MRTTIAFRVVSLRRNRSQIAPTSTLCISISWALRRTLRACSRVRSKSSSAMRASIRRHTRQRWSSLTAGLSSLLPRRILWQIRVVPRSGFRAVLALCLSLPPSPCCLSATSRCPTSLLRWFAWQHRCRPSSLARACAALRSRVPSLRQSVARSRSGSKTLRSSKRLCREIWCCGTSSW